MINPTPSQRQAIELDGKNALISAGAGSGKTSVICERIVYLLKNKKCNADEILLITFTRAAASEMKRKLRECIFEHMSNDPDAGELAAQIPLLDLAQISTIHSFCSNVIKRCYHAADADPAFSVVSGAREELLIDEAVETLYEKLYEENPSEAALLDDYFSENTASEGLKKTVTGLYRFARQRVGGMKWLREACEEFNPEKTPFSETRASVYAHDYIKREILRAVKMLDDALKLCVSYGADDYRINFLSEELSQAEALHKKAERSLKDALEAPAEAVFAAFNARKEFAYADEVKALRNGAKEIIKNSESVFGFSYEEYEQYSAKLYPVLKILEKAAAGFDEIYSSLKADRLVLDMSDLEQKCLEILSDEETASSLREEYKYVFVDEYQDTNDMQEAIINRIANKNNLYTVGDIKQSIYRFREAEPDIFIRRCDDYTYNPQNGCVITTAENFRSDRHVTDCVNGIFSRLMSRETSGCDYGDNHALIATRDIKTSAAAELHVVFTDREESNEEEKKEASKTEAEARYVASLVKRLLSEPICDPKTGEVRKTRCSDIAILSRRMNSVCEIYSRALKEEGIASLSADAANYYDLTEIALAVNMLKVTDNEKNDVALASVMRSFIYGFTDDELLLIRAHSPEKTFFYECCRVYAESGENEPLKKKLADMYAQLEDFSFAASHMPADKLIRYIYRKTKLYALSGTLPQGEERQTNLSRLISAAASYAQSSQKGLYGFIRYAEKLKESNKTFSPVSASESDAVKLMTVHKSKGLEFEVVILADTAVHYNYRSDNSALLLERNLGLCPIYRDSENMYCCDSLAKTAAALMSKRQQNAEELRILYVALTRAKQRLYVTGAVTGKTYEKYASSLLSENDILGAPSNFALLCPLADGSFMKTVTAREVLSAEAAAQEPLTDASLKADDAMKNDIEERLSYAYPYMSDTTVPAKMTVSALKASNELIYGRQITQLNDAPDFMREGQVSLGIRRGNATHKFFEKLDFSAVDKNDVPSYLKRTLKALVSENVIPEEDASLIDVKKTADFLKSDIGQKLMRAETIKKEMPFILALKASEIGEKWSASGEDILLQGVIDCFFIYENVPYILDFKTDFLPDGVSLGERHAAYEKQVRLYERAVKELYKTEKTEKYICYITMGKNVKIED